MKMNITLGNTDSHAEVARKRCRQGVRYPFLLVSLLLLTCLMSLMVLSSVHAADGQLVLAANGKSTYQIIVPDHAHDEVLDQWLMATARLMETAFQKNGFTVPVVHESAKDANKPGIYLGSTEFAKKHHIQVHTNDWSYVWKVVDNNLVILGTDQKDTELVGGRQSVQSGSMKGALDFLREHVGVRFVFYNFVDMRSSGVFDEDGSVPLDTRSIAFEKVKDVAIPASLDFKKTPLLRSRPTSHPSIENFYAVANNFFPPMKVTDTRPEVVRWSQVISVEKYGKTHPEYFALMPNGQRATQVKFGEHAMTNGSGETPLDPTNPEVQELMVQAIEKKIQDGATSVMIFPLDSLFLLRCNCDRCNALFGIGAKGSQQLQVRINGGKMWDVYFDICNRVHENYPDTEIVVWSYQGHYLEPKVVQSFPKNVVPIEHMPRVGGVGLGWDSPPSWEFFDRWSEIEMPSGLAVYEYLFGKGSSYYGLYAPDRTPEFVARMMQVMVKHKVLYLLPDGGLGYMRGLSAPTYYVYGRILDDPSANYKDLEQEFYSAAFGRASGPMSRFFDVLHQNLKLDNTYESVWHDYAKSHPYTRKWAFQTLYTPQVTAELNARLVEAEKGATDPDVKARLHFIRIEFDYVSNLGKIFTLQDAWLARPSASNLNNLLDAVEAWRSAIKSLTDGGEQPRMKPLDDWPQMIPFRSATYHDVATKGNDGEFITTSIGWDVSAIRNGALDEPKQAQVATVTQLPGIDSAAWKKVPEQVLLQKYRNVRYRDESIPPLPYDASRTTFQVLRDQDNLYVRVDSRLSKTAVKRVFPALKEVKSEDDVLKQAYVELGIQPVDRDVAKGVPGLIYRLVANPTNGVRYDAAMGPFDGKLHSENDSEWNGNWDYSYKVYSDRDGDTPPHWVAWFKIPFSNFEHGAPKSGETWKFDVGLKQGLQGGIRAYLTWHGGNDPVTVPSLMGMLKFE